MYKIKNNLCNNHSWANQDNTSTQSQFWYEIKPAQIL